MSLFHMKKATRIEAGDQVTTIKMLKRGHQVLWFRVSQESHSECHINITQSKQSASRASRFRWLLFGRTAGDAAVVIVIGVNFLHILVLSTGFNALYLWSRTALEEEILN